MDHLPPPTFGELVAPVVPPASLSGWRPAAIDNDSRRMVSGALFLACKGAEADGRDYLRDAHSRGARAALADMEGGGGERWPAPDGLTVVDFPNLDASLPHLAGQYYGWPDRQMPLAAVTGTAGKTTVAWLAAQLLRRTMPGGKPCGYIGTVGTTLMGPSGQQAQDVLAPQTNTTPDALACRRLLRDLRAEGAGAAVLEASSQGLQQGRLQGLRVQVAAFTNLGSDHLEAHGGVQALKRAKQKLFAMQGLRAAVVNLDDSFGSELAHWLRWQRPQVEVLGYGSAQDADIRLSAGGQTPAQLDLRGDSLPIPALPGHHNLVNLAAAVGIAHCFGADLGQLVKALQEPVSLPPGRLTLLFEQPSCYVDYAHSPEALATVLAELRPLCRGRLHCVFGCGGERDQGKRSSMGRIAAAGADQVLITQDNSRGEDPQSIVADILSGVRKDANARVAVELDRRRAIETALSEAAAEDLVLIAGKGHETQQWGGDGPTPFDDSAVARAWLKLQGRAQ